MSFLSAIPLNPLSIVQKWAMGIGAGLLLSSLVALWWTNGQNNKLHEEIGQAVVKLASMEDTIDSLTAQRDSDLRDLGILREQRDKARNAMSKVIEELEELKRHEDMVQDDPAGFELIINDRLDRLFIDLSCASGSQREDCTAPANETGPDESPEP